MSTLEQVCQIVADRLSRDWRSLKPEHSLAVDLGADSLDLAEIVMDVEDAFHLHYRDLDDVGSPTIGRLVELVESVKKEPKS